MRFLYDFIFFFKEKSCICQFLNCFKFRYSGTCLIQHTNGPGKCVGYQNTHILFQLTEILLDHKFLLDVTECQKTQVLDYTSSTVINFLTHLCLIENLTILVYLRKYQNIKIFFKTLAKRNLLNLKLNLWQLFVVASFNF